MKIQHLCQKPVSVFVMIAFAFMLCFWANQTPAASSVPAADDSATASLESHEDESPGFIEQEDKAPAVRKGKKFPWLLVALVVVGGGAALYFLVLKKKNYTLTVTVGEGVTGTPAAGASTMEKGTTVSYSYSLQSGYSDLVVTLDGAAVAASGTVTMNGNHTLEARATKTFVLTVNRGQHVDGTPATGTYTHARGTNVSYSYAPASGYSNLEVKIDNVAAPNSGTIAMNDNHTLEANIHGANIVVNSTPAGARIYMNNVDTGFNTPYSFTFPNAVTKTVLLRGGCGYKEYTQTVSVTPGQTKTINATLANGIKEEFDIPNSSCWLPYYTADWDTNNHGEYRFKGNVAGWATSFYNYAFSGDYILTVRMTRVAGSLVGTGLFLGTSTSATSASGYLFTYYPYTPTGQYGIFRFNGFNFISNSGPWVSIKNANHAAIKVGLNQFNVLKIAKTGSTYSYYINNTLMHTFSDATYNPEYIALAAYCGNVSTHMEYEFVYLDPAAGSGGFQRPPAIAAPAMEKETAPFDPATGEKRK